MMIVKIKKPCLIIHSRLLILFRNDGSTTTRSNQDKQWRDKRIHLLALNLNREIKDAPQNYKKVILKILRCQWKPAKCRNNDHRTFESLLVTLDGIESAPVDLAFFDYHCSSLKSVWEPRSQMPISTCVWRDSEGSSARCSNAR